MIRHGAVIVVIATVVVWLIIGIAAANRDGPAEPTTPPTVSYTDCWPEIPR